MTQSYIAEHQCTWYPGRLGKQDSDPAANADNVGAIICHMQYRKQYGNAPKPHSEVNPAGPRIPPSPEYCRSRSGNGNTRPRYLVNHSSGNRSRDDKCQSRSRQRHITATASQRQTERYLLEQGRHSKYKPQRKLIRSTAHTIRRLNIAEQHQIGHMENAVTDRCITKNHRNVLTILPAARSAASYSTGETTKRTMSRNFALRP